MWGDKVTVLLVHEAGIAGASSKQFRQRSRRVLIQIRTCLQVRKDQFNCFDIRAS